MQDSLDAVAVRLATASAQIGNVLGSDVAEQAIQAFYKDQAHEAWVEMDAPATVERIQSACRVAVNELKL